MWQIRCSSPAICSHLASCRETFCIWFFFFFFLRVVDVRIREVWTTYTASKCDVFRGIFFEYMHWDTVITLEFQLYFVPDIIAAVLYVGVITGGWLHCIFEAGTSELKCIFHAAAERSVSCCWVLKRVLWRPVQLSPHYRTYVRL